MGPDRITVIQVIRPAGDNSSSAKLYQHLINLDAAFFSQKVSGSIELHYSQGVLGKIHERKVIG